MAEALGDSVPKSGFGHNDRAVCLPERGDIMHQALAMAGARRLSGKSHEAGMPTTGSGG